MALGITCTFHRTVISFEVFCLVQVFIVSLVYFAVLGKEEFSVYSLIENLQLYCTYKFQHIKIISGPDQNYPDIFENGFFSLFSKKRPYIFTLNKPR